MTITTIVVNAWLCDDAYISFRVVDNFINGYGLTWNTFERVQAYSNPLLVLCLSIISLFTREIYYTSIIFSVVVSCIAIYILLFKISKNYILSVSLGLIIILSKSFISFTTSGLENCLSFLLLALYYHLFFKKEKFNYCDLISLSLLASLALVNRMDSILLFIPSLIYAFIFKKEKQISLGKSFLLGLIGMIPFICWEIFALIYYGFPFPNTAYAKLYTSFPFLDYFLRGIKYYIANFLFDPITLLSIGFTIITCIAMKKMKNIIALLGVLFYMIYIIKIGGDFMNGRFFTAPLFLALIVCANLLSHSKEHKYYVSVIVILIAIQGLYLQLYEEGISGDFASRFVNGYATVNERSVYAPATGLKENLQMEGLNNLYIVKDGVMLKESKAKVAVRHAIGFTGYYAGPNVRIIDELALSDALLSRMPVVADPYSPDQTTWRIGHIFRWIPAGYVKTVESGINQIEDERVKEYYNKLKIITQGEIFSLERFKTIINMNLGKYDYLIK